MINTIISTSYPNLDCVLCLDAFTGKAATVARFMYRDTESVGEGDRLDTAAVHI